MLIKVSHQQKIYTPIALLLCWLVFTISVFMFGPYKYKLTNLFFFYLYLLLINLSLFIGYIRGQKSYGRESKIKIDYIKFLRATIIIAFTYLVVKLIFTNGGDMRNFFTTFRDASVAYSQRTTNHPSLFLYLDIFATPITMIAITNGIFSFRKLMCGYRFCVYFMIFCSIASSIGSGTRAGIVDMTLIIISSFLLGIYKKNIILKAHHKLLLVFSAVIVTVGFFAYVALLTENRSNYTPINPLTNELPDKEFILFKIFPKNVQPAINNTSFYLSHSYFRLNQAFDLPFNGLGYGLTNSYFVMRNIQELTGWSGLTEISYGLRLDMKQNGFFGNYWSTFYTWIASDFTFTGTIFVVFLIGYFFSLALRDSLLSENPLSVTVFCILFVFIFHFAFNNPLQDASGITTVLGLTSIWLLLRKRSKPITSLQIS